MSSGTGSSGAVELAGERAAVAVADVAVVAFIRPGTDASFLAAIVHTIFADGLVRLGRLETHTVGVERVRELVAPLAPEAVARHCAIPAATIRAIAHDLARAERPVVYGRIGTCTQEFGTLASWLVDVINVLLGSLDAPGGAMFTKPATGWGNTRGTPGRGKGVRFGRRHSRVAAHRRSTASSPPPASPRRPTRPATAAFVHSSPSPATRC